MARCDTHGIENCKDKGCEVFKAEDKKLLTEIADYLTNRFICDSKELPADECIVEAMYILDKICERIEDTELPPKQIIKIGRTNGYYAWGNDNIKKLLKEHKQAILNAIKE